MNIIQLIFKELWHRKWQSFLSMLAVVTAVALFVAFQTTGEASQRETTRVMRDIGYNLRIIPKETDMNRFWAEGYSQQSMPEDYVNAFAEYTKKGIIYNHLLATAKKEISWNGRQVIVCGIASEICPPGKQKPSMIFEIKSGTVYVGYQIAADLNLKQGDTIEMRGEEYVVEKALAERGTEEDIYIWANLRDAQKWLGMEGRINEIRAIECRCMREDMTVLEVLRSQLDEILPEARVIQMKSVAEARQKQRRMQEKYYGLIMPMILLVCAVWIGALAMLNARERRQELGVMRALGYGSSSIAVLFLGKAIILGIVGALIGFGIGSWIAMAFGPSVFQVTAKALRVEYSQLWIALVFAPLLAALSSFIPAMIGVAQDPAVVLRDE